MKTITNQKCNPSCWGQGLASFLAAAARVATNPITSQVAPTPLLHLPSSM